MSLDDRPLTQRLQIMLVSAGAIRLVVSVGLVIFWMRGVYVDNARRLLTARADQVAAILDGRHRQYSALVGVLGHSTNVRDLCDAGSSATESQITTVTQKLARTVFEDHGLRGAALVDRDGIILAAHLASYNGRNVSTRLWFRGMTGGETVSDLFLSTPDTGATPVFVHSGPVDGPGGCHVALSVKGGVVSDAIAAAESVGLDGMTTVLVDRHGVRFGRSRDPELVYHPTGPVDPAYEESAVADARFGERTRELLDVVAPSPELYARATSETLEGFPVFFPTEVEGKSATGVSRRLAEAPWTVFVVVPGSVIDGPLTAAMWKILALAAVLLGATTVEASRIAAAIRAPLGLLLAATERMRGGNLSARVGLQRQDELGQLAASFDAMAARLESDQATLETRVRERTQALDAANALLEEQKRRVEEQRDVVQALAEEAQAQTEELQAQAEELQAQQRELELKNQEVERANRLKSEFLASMSHELRTPLNAILGFSDLLLQSEDDPLTASQAQHVRRVLESGQHLLSLINDVLDLSRIEAGALPLALSDVSPSAAVDDACVILRPLARRRGITIRPRTSPTPTVRADRGRLHQVLLNLLSNAVKFGPDGSIVEVKVEEAPGQRVRFSVRDEGPGIDPDLMPRIFTPFAQGDTGLVKRHDGTGLGLAISKRLVEQHGGDVEVRTAPGWGTEISFTLPITSQAEGPAPAPARTSATGPAVLVADPDPRARRIVRETLEPAGWFVTEAEESQAALAAARQHPPDALVTELDFPDGSVAQMLVTLAEEKLHPATLALSSRDPTEAELRTLSTYVRRFARKGSLAPGELIAILRTGALPPDAPHVLVVDDHAPNRELLRRMLEREGCRVTLAADGELGVRLCTELRPALVLMDLAMPGMDGFTATRALKSDPTTAEIPVVAVTAMAMTKDEERARGAGMAGYLTKPVDRQRLVRVLQQFLPSNSDPPSAGSAEGG